MDVKKIVIIGAGEFAQIAYEYFTYDSDYEVAAFSVEREYLSENILYDLPVVPFEEIQSLYPASEYMTFVAIPASGLNSVRTRLYHLVKEKGYKCATYISSHAFVWRNVQMGENCFVFEDNTIQPFVTVGNNVVLWSGNHVGHRSVIEDNCFITSHSVISGYCRIGSGSFVGVNSTFNDNTSIPSKCIVGSGAVITRSQSVEEAIYIGSPAKPVPEKSSLSVKL
jgi:sugar O-acyltransferase (sialic acid O-acetyltransferase NeuD family)